MATPTLPYFQAETFAPQQQPDTYNGAATARRQHLLNIALLIFQNIGEPPTLHRLQVLQRFQAAYRTQKTANAQAFAVFFVTLNINLRSV